jgi:hypothetical protein
MFYHQLHQNNLTADNEQLTACLKQYRGQHVVGQQDGNN